MRTEGIKVKLIVPFYYDKPDKNGNIYTREVILKALRDAEPPVPIHYCDDNYDICIGLTDRYMSFNEDTVNNRFLVTINGTIGYGGTNENVIIDKDTKVITDFVISSIGLSI